MTGLLPAEKVAGSADLQVLHRHLDPGTEIGVRGNGREPVVGGFGQRLLRGVQEVGVSTLTTAPHAAAQLVGLGKAELVGPLDDQGVGVGDVEAGLHDRGADQDVELLVPEVLDDPLELVFAHPAVGHAHSRLRHQFLQVSGGLGDRLHPVVHIEDLALTQQLAADGSRHLALLVLAHEGQDRMAFLGWGGQGRHLPDAGDRHLQRARDRRGRHGQHVDVGPHLLQGLLVLDTEALLLIHDHQAEVLEVNLSRNEAVGADHHVHAPSLTPSRTALAWALLWKRESARTFTGKPA